MITDRTMYSQYLQYLPRLFKEGVGEETAFLGQYLKIFEALLTGREDNAAAKKTTGLEQCIKQYINCLDPGLTPVEEVSYPDPGPETILDSSFLTYLAQWVALVFDQDWPLGKKRQWLQKIVPLYKKRGTISGLLEYLNMFVGKQVEIEEPSGGFIVGKESTIGYDTFLGGTPPYYFRVRINYGFPPDENFDIDVWNYIKKAISAIVDLEKPAHTQYDMVTCTPGIIVGVQSTVGIDTWIWEKS